MAHVGSIVLSALLVLGPAGLCSAQASFTGLGDLGGPAPFSKALGISADGSVVVGYSMSPSGYQAFHWQGGVMTPLAGLPGTSSLHDRALDVSGDGTRIVGRAKTSTGDAHAVVWEGISATPTDLGAGEALGLSTDGSAAVGQTLEGHLNGTPACWSDGDPNGIGPLDPNSLEFLDPNGRVGTADATSSDGSVIVGTSLSQAFRWQDGVMERLPGLGAVDPNGNLDPEVSSVGLDVSSDGGSVIVGSTGGWPQEAFHWRASPVNGEDGVLIPLGSLWDPNHTRDPNRIDSRAFAASADGRAVVGRSFTPDLRYEAFFWSGGPGMQYPTENMENLKEVLEGYGLDLSGWVLERAEDVSADGHTIVGWGTNSNPPDPNMPSDPHTEAWIAVLPAPTDTLCGDTNDDGYVYHSDIDALRRALADPAGQPLSSAGLSKCSVIGSATSCDVVDVVVLQRVLSYPWLPPPIADVCEAVASP